MNRTKEEIKEYDDAIADWISAANRSPLKEAKALYLITAEELRIERDTGKITHINQRTS